MPSPESPPPSVPKPSRERFLQLFLGSEREVYRYISAIAPARGDADEILQQTALELWMKFDQFDHSLPFTPLACRFALIVAKRWLASKRRWSSVLSEGLIERIADRREAVLPGMQERLRHLDACLEKLPVAQRVMIDGYYFRRLPIESMATDAGRSIDAVYKALQRIRQALQDCVARAERLEATS